MDPLDPSKDPVLSLSFERQSEAFSSDKGVQDVVQKSLSVENKSNKSAISGSSRIYTLFFDPIVTQGANWFQSIGDRIERVKLAPIVRRAFKREKEEVIEKMIPFIQGIQGDIQCDKRERQQEVLAALNELSAEERASIIQTVGPMVRSVKGFARVVLIRIASCVPKEQRSEKVMAAVVSLIKDVEDIWHLKNLPEAVQKLLPNERVDVIEKAADLHQKLDLYKWERGNLLISLSEIPKEERGDVIEKVISHTRQHVSASILGNACKAMYYLPKNQREELSSEMGICFRQFYNGWGFNDQASSLFVEVLKSLSRDILATALKKTITLLSEDQGELTSWEMFILICYISPKELPDAMAVMRMAPQFGANPGRLTIYRIMGSIPEAQRMAALPILTSFVKTARRVNQDISNLFYKGILEVAEEHRLEFTEKVVSFSWEGTSSHVQLPGLLRMTDSFQTLSKDWDFLFDRVSKLRPPSLQEDIFKLAIASMQDEKIRKIFDSKLFKTSFPAGHTLIFRLLTACLLSRGLLEERDVQAMGVIFQQDQYKDVDKRKTVIGALRLLMDTPEGAKCLGVIFSADAILALNQQKINLQTTSRKSKNQEERSVASQEVIRLKKELEEKETQILQFLSYMEAIIYLSPQALKKIQKPQNLETILKTLFVKSLTISFTGDFLEKCFKKFSEFRLPESVFMYMAKLQTLSPEQRGPCLRAFGCYIKEVVEGRFTSSRYKESASKHLATVFKGREELKRLWMKGENRPLEAFVVPSSTQKAFDTKTYLRQRIVTDQHILPEEMPDLQKTLNGFNVSNDLEESPPGLRRLEWGLIALLKADTDDRLGLLRSNVLPFIEQVLPLNHPFARDLRDLEKMLAPQKREASFAGWTVVDSDDPQDLLMCGTDVIGSCQNINGTPDYNKCLLAYLLDGKNRLIAVKNEKGEMMARCIFRILWDAKLRRPVLFKERVYTKPPADERVIGALDTMCKDRASKLGLTLVESSQDGEGTPYPNRLHSFGCLAPFEYVDAGGQGVTNGSFEVRGVVLQ